MPPQHSSSCGKPRPGKKPTTPGLSAAASAPTKKVARPASAPNNMALHAGRPSKMACPPSQPSSAARRPPHLQSPTPKKSAALSRQQAACSSSKKPESESFMAPRDAKTVRPARRLAPGTAVGVRTRLTMITEKCCLVIWLPARIVSAPDAYHYTVKYSANLSPAFAGRMVRKSVDHVRVVAPQRATVNNAEPPRNMEPPQRVTDKAKPPRNMAPAPERKDRFL